jgi:hypothetical protein
MCGFLVSVQGIQHGPEIAAELIEVAVRVEEAREFCVLNVVRVWGCSPSALPLLSLCHPVTLCACLCVLWWRVTSCRC